MSIMGGIGMMSAGLIGSPGLGYAKDRFAGESLQTANAAAFTEYKSAAPSKFLFFSEVHGLDGAKLGEVQTKLANARTALAAAGNTDPQAALDKLSETERQVQKSSIEGDRKTLRADSAIPATMALIYLLLLLYFKAIGGYKPLHIDGGGEQAKKAA